MDCPDGFCWTSHSFPDFPPPPPLPNFLKEEIEEALNQTLSSGLGCDLCSWAGATPIYEESIGDHSLPLSSLLVIVALVSAFAGAGLTASILALRRLRNRKFNSTSGPVRHLARKCNESSRTLPSSSAVFPMTSSFSENTYCEGPYNNDNNKDGGNNIYAELTPANSSVWTRPPISPPSVDHSYLELNDLQNNCGRCHGRQGIGGNAGVWIQRETGSVSSYYSDLDIARRAARPICNL